MGGKVRVKQKTIILNTVVLNNSKSKKPIPGAKIVLEELGGAKQFFDANKLGKYEGVFLQPEKQYRVYAEAEGKKSAAADISTVGNKSAKIINQVLYLEGKPEKATSKELMLDVLVKAFKTKKPVPNTNIILIDADGEKYEGITNSKGVLKGIELSPEMKYELYANKDGHVSEKETFTTGTIAEGKRISKTLFLTYDENPIILPSGVTLNSEECGDPGSYERYFTYNKRDVEIEEACWGYFIDQVVEKASKLGKKKRLTISIDGSASRVPRRGRGGNKALAAMRANNMEKKIKAALKKKGIKASKVRFKKVSGVKGPKYKGDWNLGRKKYEKFQYVKAKIK